MLRDGDKIVFHALVYRSEPVAIVKEGLPVRVIGMTWRRVMAKQPGQ